MAKAELKVLMPVATKAWLKHASKTSGRKMNDVVLLLLADAMKSDPLRVIVREVAVSGLPTVFTVSIGEFGDDLIDTLDRNEALAFARDKIAELGLPKTALTFNTVADKAA